MTHIYSNAAGDLKITLDNDKYATLKQVILHAASFTENGWVADNSIPINMQTAVCLVEQLTTFIEMSRRRRSVQEIDWWVERGSLYVNNVLVVVLVVDTDVELLDAITALLVGKYTSSILHAIPSGLSDAAYECLITERITAVLQSGEF